MTIDYQVNKAISAAQFVQVLKRSTLGERRPIDNTVCIQGMLDNSNLIVSAWAKQTLIGVARCVTDFHYACYLSDLAVDSHWQCKGIGKTLIEETHRALQPGCTLILLAAPKAHKYYEKRGFSRHERCWIQPTDSPQ